MRAPMSKTIAEYLKHHSHELTSKVIEARKNGQNRIKITVKGIDRIFKMG